MDTASANDCNIDKSLKLVKGWSSITSEEEDGGGGGTAILRKLRRFSNLVGSTHRSFLEITLPPINVHKVELTPTRLLWTLQCNFLA